MSKKPIIPENIDTLIVDLILDYYNIQEINGHRKALTSEKFDEIIIKAEKENKFYVEEGTVEFSNNNLLILTSTAKELKNFDKGLINSLIEKEVSKLRDHKISDKDRYMTSHKVETLKEIS